MCFFHRQIAFCSVREVWRRDGRYLCEEFDLGVLVRRGVVIQGGYFHWWLVEKMPALYLENERLVFVVVVAGGSQFHQVFSPIVQLDWN